MPKQQKCRSFRDAMRWAFAVMPQAERMQLMQQLDQQRQSVGKAKAAQIDQLQSNLLEIWAESPPVK